MSQTAPSTYTDLIRTVEQYTAEVKPGGWYINSFEDEIPQGRLVGFPFANSSEGVGVRFCTKREGLTLAANISSKTLHDIQNNNNNNNNNNSKNNNWIRNIWLGLRPTLSWTTKTSNGAQHELQLNTHSHFYPEFLSFSPLNAPSPLQLKSSRLLLLCYVLRHPHLFFSLETDPLDGLHSSLTASTRLSLKDQICFRALYDPSRSGLRDYTIAGVRIGSAALWGGDILAKYNGKDGAGIHARIPVHRYASGVALFEQKRVVLGVEGRSPCGSQVMMSANIIDNVLAFNLVRNIDDIWKVSIHYSTPFPGCCSSSSSSSTSFSSTSKIPRFGLVFTSQNSN